MGEVICRYLVNYEDKKLNIFGSLLSPQMVIERDTCPRELVAVQVYWEQVVSFRPLISRQPLTTTLSSRDPGVIGIPFTDQEIRGVGLPCPLQRTCRRNIN